MTSFLCYSIGGPSATMHVKVGFSGPLGAMIMAAADFIVESADHKTQLIVETKKKSPASAAWAALLRRNLFAHLRLPPARFFLLALPERFYLWKDAAPQAVVPPNYEADAGQVLKPYVDKLQTPLSDLSESSFELLVRSWLEDVISSSSRQEMALAPESWLVQSGLYEAIRHGSVKTHTSR